MRAHAPARSVRRAFAAAGITLVSACAAADVAAAQTPTSPTCRGSAARVAVGSAVVAEPIAANAPGAPCATQAARLAGVQPVGPLSVSAPEAATRRSPGVVAASASVASVRLDGPIPVTVGVVSATQLRSCVNGRTVSSGSSFVDDLVVGGIRVPVVAGASIDVQVAGVRVRTNTVAGSTRQALVLELPGTQLVLGEATAGGDACAAGGGGSAGTGGGDDPSGAICPDGASYRVQQNVCVIEVTGPGGAVERTIVVGRPYTGPSGGTVVALSEAREMVAAGRLEASACLRGRGPAYVILGGAGADRITGTNGADRILGRAGSDSIAGGRGEDCIDGGTGADRLDGSAGADRVFGGSGRDNLNGGPAADRLSGGSGADTLNTAFGRDRAFGGSGRDAINAATSGPPATVSAGPGRDTVRVNRNERRRVRGAEIVHTIR